MIDVCEKLKSKSWFQNWCEKWPKGKNVLFSQKAIIYYLFVWFEVNLICVQIVQSLKNVEKLRVSQLYWSAGHRIIGSKSVSQNGTTMMTSRDLVLNNIWKKGPNFEKLASNKSLRGCKFWHFVLSILLDFIRNDVNTNKKL